MEKQLRCACGASLIAPAHAKVVVCGQCQRTIAIPQEVEPTATNIGLSETVPAFTAEQRPPAAAPRSRKRTRRIVLMVFGLVTLAMAVLIVIYAVGHMGPRTVTVDAGAITVDAATTRVEPTTQAPIVGPEKLGTSAALATGLRAAIASGDRDRLAALIDEQAFGIGVDRGDVATGQGRVVDVIVRALGPSPTTVASTFSRAGTAPGAAWFVDELGVTGNGRTRRFVMTYLAIERPAGWKVAAIHFALPVGNRHAFELAKAELLPEPAAIPDTSGAADLEAAFRAAFASRPALVAAFSDRPEAYNRGSAPGENSIGGPTIKREFGRMSSEIRIQDGVAVGTPAKGIGWGAANVAFTMTVRSSRPTERAAADAKLDAVLATQIFRVLAIFAEERQGWKIVSLHWSNAGPIPPLPPPAGSGVTTAP